MHRQIISTARCYVPFYKFLWKYFSSVIRQKGGFQNACFKETKQGNFSEKTNISYPLIRTRTCTYQWVKNVLFSENLDCLVSLKHPFWDSPFCLITNDKFWDSPFCLITNVYCKSLVLVQTCTNRFSQLFKRNADVKILEK